jgi:hypothetical protein
MSSTVEDLKRTRSLRSRRAGGYQNRLLNPGDCAPALREASGLSSAASCSMEVMREIPLRFCLPKMEIRVREGPDPRRPPPWHQVGRVEGVMRESRSVFAGQKWKSEYAKDPTPGDPLPGIRWGGWRGTGVMRESRSVFAGQKWKSEYAKDPTPGDPLPGIRWGGWRGTLHR